MCDDYDYSMDTMNNYADKHIAGLKTVKAQSTLRSGTCTTLSQIQNLMEIDGLPSTVIPPPAVTLIFDLLTRTSNQHIYELEYIYDQNWAKFPSLVCEIRWCSQSFRDAQTRRLTHVSLTYT